MDTQLIIKLSAFTVAMILLIVASFVAKNKKYLRFLGIVGSIYGIVYMVWRITFTIPVDSVIATVCGIILLMAELSGLGQSLVFKTIFSTNRKVDFKRDVVFTELPAVDVFISTYNEPVDVLTRTIVAATKIDYPKNKLKIYVGDDGSREEVRALCEKAGAIHVTREDHSHAKAGNINNMLSLSSGKYILTLDADMIPKKSIISDMVFYFEDSRCGFVQAPQVFYNNDIYQYNLKAKEGIPNEQDFFMRTILEKRALYNAVLHVGSNAIFSRQALTDIGGIPTSSITEDMATGMLIQAKGYKSFFVNKALAVGLSVENIFDQVKQRDRWLRGNVQVIKKNNPLTIKGLSFFQRMIYLDGFFYWTSGLQKMIYIIAPLLYLLFRVKVFSAQGLDIVLIFIPYFLSNSLYFKRVTDKSRNLTWSHIYDTALAPHLAWSFLTEFLFGKELKFNVTPKGNTTTKDKFNTRLALPHIVFLSLSVFSILANIGLIIYGNLFGGILPAIIINLLWCTYNALAIFVAIFLFIDRRRVRSSERIPVELQTTGLFTNCNYYKTQLNKANNLLLDSNSKANSDYLCTQCGIVTDISDVGAQIFSNVSCEHFNFVYGEKVNLTIKNIGAVTGTVIRMSSTAAGKELGIKFEDVSFEVINNINKYRFALTNKYVTSNRINANIDHFLEIIGKMIF